MKVVCIGSGNIATHLSKAFYALGHQIVQIYSKTSANAKALADVVNTTLYTDKLENIVTTADLYLIAVSDQVITDIVQDLPSSLKGIVVHTSGATSIEILSQFTNFGVIYPPQSINKNIATDLSKIPFGIEANSQEVTSKLFGVMNHISQKNFSCNSRQRVALHLSAVLVNNFSNALYQMADDILNSENLDFELLKPIILETAQKVQNHNPKEVQTGPAIRNDQITINKHLEFLSHSKELAKIYQDLSDFIIKRRHK